VYIKVSCDGLEFHFFCIFLQVIIKIPELCEGDSQNGNLVFFVDDVFLDFLFPCPWMPAVEFYEKVECWKVKVRYADGFFEWGGMDSYKLRILFL